jgi:hypothetical protein
MIAAVTVAGRLRSDDEKASTGIRRIRDEVRE